MSQLFSPVAPMIGTGANGIYKSRLLKMLFHAATLLALVYVLLAIARQWQEISTWHPDALTMLALIALVFIYGASLFLQAEMWHRLVQAIEKKPLPRALTLPSYTETQIGKYLPGNVFHLIGRHTFLSSTGIGHRQLVRAFMFEVVFLLCGAGIVAATGLLLSTGSVGGYSMSMLGAGGLVLIVLIAAFAFTRLTGSPTVRYGTGIVALALSTGFFLCQGLVFFTICHLVSPAAELFAIPSASLSWMAGYVVIGAPGGLGVREFVLLTLNGLGLDRFEVLIAIALFRGVTVFGDVVCFAAGRLIMKRL